MKISKHISILVLMFIAHVGFAQQHTTKAYGHYQAQAFDSAKFWIDSAVVSGEKSNSQTWQLRGLIYRKLESAENKGYREIAIESFLEARTVDTEGKHKEKIDGYLYNTVIRYYNDAVTHLGANNLEGSEKSYINYKEKFLAHVDANKDFTANDIEFYNALGSEYLKLISTLSGEDKTEKTLKGVAFFEKVLKLDPNQFQPNFNVGIMYYNSGADLIMNMDPLTPIEEIPVIEEKAQNSFRKALPFLLEAHKMQVDRTDVIEAITGCYYGLQDDENYTKFQKILDEKNLPTLLEKHTANPKDRVVVRELVRIYSTTFKDDEKYKKYAEILDNLEE